MLGRIDCVHVESNMLRHAAKKESYEHPKAQEDKKVNVTVRALFFPPHTTKTAGTQHAQTA